MHCQKCGLEAVNTGTHEKTYLCPTCKAEDKKLVDKILGWMIGIIFLFIMVLAAGTQETSNSTLTESAATDICLDAFDYRRGKLNISSMRATPWDSHATKAFRVAMTYERNGFRYGFGCTVYKDRRAETNYNE